MSPHKLPNRHWPPRLHLTRPGTGARPGTLLGARTGGRFEAECLLDLAGGGGGEGSLQAGRARRVVSGRVRIGYVGEGLAGGGAADSDEDLVGGESEVGIGELGGELAEWGWEIGGRRSFGSHYWWW